MDNLKYLTKEQLLERYSELQQEYIDLQNENESLNDYVSELEYSNDNSDLDNNDITDDIDSTELNNNEPQIIDSKPQKEVKISDSNEMDDDDDDNLFDLIDSMYDKE